MNGRNEFLLVFIRSDHDGDDSENKRENLIKTGKWEKILRIKRKKKQILKRF